jgi:two-component system sensor histidine kinase UhpB
VHRFEEPEILHLDLMTRLEKGKESIPFFISFKMNVLARVVRASTVAELDRRRIAVDMHDQVLSDLSSLSKQCELMLNNVQNPERMHCHLADSSNILENVESSIRTIIDDLHPQSLELLGLKESLRAYIVRHFSEIEGFDIEFQISHYQGAKFTNKQRLNLYRIALEIIHNIVRHADAHHCLVSLEKNRRRFKLMIEDDSKAFRPDKIEFAQSGGLATMNTRASLLSATVTWGRRTSLIQGLDLN